MTGWLRAAERWLRTPTERANFALFQGLFCAALALQILIHFREQLDFLARRAKFDAALDLPVPYLQHAPLLGIFHVPELGPPAFCVVGAVLVAALLGAGLGYRARLLLALSLVAYFLYFGQILELGYVRRKTNGIPFILLILLLSPDLSRRTPTEVLRGIRRPGEIWTPAWPLVLVKLFLGWPTSPPAFPSSATQDGPGRSATCSRPISSSTRSRTTGRWPCGWPGARPSASS